MAELLNRFGRRLARLSGLEIDYPVGRAGTGFRAQLASDTVEGLDTARLRYFLVEDDQGQRFPATITRVCRTAEDGRLSCITGVVVARG